MPPKKRSASPLKRRSASPLKRRSASPLKRRSASPLKRRSASLRATAIRKTPLKRLKNPLQRRPLKTPLKRLQRTTSMPAARPGLQRTTSMPAARPGLQRTTSMPAGGAGRRLQRLGSMPTGTRPPLSLNARKPSFSEQLAKAPSVNVEGGVPLYALLNSEMAGNANHRVRVPKYNLFKEGALITDPRYVREYTANEKRLMAARPPVCVGQQLVLSDPQSCYVKGMESRLQKTYAEVAKYRGTAGNNPFCDMTNPKLQTHQEGIFELARAMATRTPEELGGARGLLCYHSTGSGKTVTSLGIVLAFWDSPREIVLATTPDNRSDNNLSKYAVNLFKMFPDYVAKVFPRAPREFKAPWTPEKNKALDDWCKDPTNRKPLENRVKTFTFTTLSSELCIEKAPGVDIAGKDFASAIGPGLLMGKYGGKCGEPAKNASDKRGGKVGSVLIMDEVQSLFTPDPKFARSAKYLVKELMQEKYRKRVMIFALTATPGNSVDNIINVLNFVRPLNMPALTEGDIMTNPNKFRGLVSYADIRGDTSRYGIKTVKNIYVPMADKYYMGYLKTIGKLTAENLNYSKAERASKELGFMSKQKAAGNSLAKTALAGLYTEAELNEMKTVKGSGGVLRVVDIGRGQLRLVSDKLRAALDNAMKMPGKQYMYIGDASTNKVVIALLEKMGYSPIGSKDYTRSGKKYTEGPRLATKAPRFIMYRAGSVTSASGAKEALDEHILKAYSATFGARKNDSGEFAKIIIASGTFYQGFDTRALQGVHLVDPLFNVAADKQAVGRGLRLCGHSGAPATKVTVYRYFSVPPPRFDLDKFSQGLKGAAQKRAMNLEPLAQELAKLTSPANTQGVEGVDGPIPPGINTFIFKDAIRRNKAVEYFERLLKAMAVDCSLFKSIFHANEPFKCGVPPSGSMAVTSFSPAAALKVNKVNTTGGTSGRKTTGDTSGRKTTPAKMTAANYKVSAAASAKLNAAAARYSKPGGFSKPSGFSRVFSFDRKSSNVAYAPSNLRPPTRPGPPPTRLSTRPGPPPTRLPTRPGPPPTRPPTRPGAPPTRPPTRPGPPPQKPQKPQKAKMFKSMNEVPARVMLKGKTMAEVNASYARKRTEAVRKGRTKLVAALNRARAARLAELGDRNSRKKSLAESQKKPQKTRKTRKLRRVSPTVAIRPVKKPDGTSALRFVAKKPTRPRRVGVKVKKMKIRRTTRTAKPSTKTATSPRPSKVRRRKIGIRVRRRR